MKKIIILILLTVSISFAQTEGDSLKSYYKIVNFGRPDKQVYYIQEIQLKDSLIKITDTLTGKSIIEIKEKITDSVIAKCIHPKWNIIKDSNVCINCKVKWGLKSKPPLVSYMILRKGILYWVWADKTIHPVKELEIIKEPIIKEIIK
jgi:hypothetical protein